VDISWFGLVLSTRYSVAVFVNEAKKNRIATNLQRKKVKTVLIYSDASNFFYLALISQKISIF